jgi:hypothetical protein
MFEGGELRDSVAVRVEFRVEELVVMPLPLPPREEGARADGPGGGGRWRWSGCRGWRGR